MLEVVDLISSDDEPTITRTVPAVRKAFHANFDLSLDDDDDDFPWSTRTKRRKLNTPPAVNGPFTSTTKVQDDIVFTSSPKQDPEPDTQASVWTVMDSEKTPSEISPIAAKRTGLSSRTAELLDEITVHKVKKKRANKEKGKAEEISDDEKTGSLSPSKVAKSSTKDRAGQHNSSAERQAKAAQREQQRENKAAEKETARQAREDAKAIKATEKQRAADIASVNRSKLDKNVTTPEMMVDFPLSMDGSSSLTQCREFLRKANSDTSLYHSEIPGIIKFRRKIRADFNDAEGCFLPVQPRIDEEKMILLYLLAEDLARLISPLAIGDETMEEHLARVRRLQSNCRVILVIEGLEKLIAKEKNASDRAYQAAVRRAAAAALEKEQQEINPRTTAPEPTGRRQNKANANYIVDEPAIEAALLSLQVKDSIQIHHCTTPLDTGETVLAMTQQLSLSRYRDPPVLSAAQLAVQPNFCMSTGQVPTGRSVEDTYLKILQQVIRVTEREATAIAKVYPSVGSLFRAFKTQGDRVLEDIMKEGGGARGSTNGIAAAERRIGPRTSERFGRIFLGLDAVEMIG